MQHIDVAGAQADPKFWGGARLDASASSLWNLTRQPEA